MTRSVQRAPTSSRKSRLCRCGRTIYRLREWPCRKRSRSSREGHPLCWKGRLCHGRLPCLSRPCGRLHRWILLLQFRRGKMNSTGRYSCDSHKFRDSEVLRLRLLRRSEYFWERELSPRVRTCAPISHVGMRRYNFDLLYLRDSPLDGLYHRKF